MSRFFNSCFRPCVRPRGRSDAPRDVDVQSTKENSSIFANATTPVSPATSWSDFLVKYRKGEISTNAPTRPLDMPDDEKFLRAGIPPDERERQLAMYKYTYMDEPNYHDGQPAEGEEATPQSDTLFRIVNLARTTFNVNVALISLLDDECQYFKSEVGLASVGLSGMESVPRDISFCGHTILNKAPMVILDCSKDWRMQNNPLVANPPGVRFYAGVPIVAPEGYALGTLCIIDLEARTEFHGSAKMQELAHLAMTEIRALYERNQADKMRRMHSALADFPNATGAISPSAASMHVASALELEESRLRMHQSFTPEQQQAVLKAGRNQGLKVVAKTGSLTSAHAERQNPGKAFSEQLSNNAADRSSTEMHSTSANVNGEYSESTQGGNAQETQQTATPTTTNQMESAKNPYDLSVLLIAQTLNLDLVYLLALDEDASSSLRTRVVSAFGLAPDPVFDANLHGRALRSKSGLLYVHPDPDGEVAKELGTYISGMLVPVLQLSGGGGYVLAAFTKKKSQIFVAEDLKFLRDFGVSLLSWLNRV